MKVLMFTIAIMMTSFVACDRKTPETKLNEQRMEVNEDYREKIQGSKEELNKDSYETSKQHMEDSADFQGDVNKAGKKRNEELNEVNEDYLEEKKD